MFLIAFFLGISLHANEIDAYLKSENKQFAVCSDEVFIRRLYISLTGRLPKTEKVVQFLNSKHDKKRQLLIDEVLDSDEYVSFMVLRWGDILRVKSEFPSNLWPNSVQAYNRWLWEEISKNTPYNTFVSNLLLCSGSNFRSPAVNVYRAVRNRTAEGFYQNISLLFLGSRKTLDDGHLFFSQLKFKSTKEWKEEIVYVDVHATPNVPKVQMFDGKELALPDDVDLRVPFVAWLTNKSNTRFSSVMVNRIWYWCIGKGIVQEPDDWGSHNLPSNARLLQFLTSKFVDSNFDVKAMFRLILNSSAFQSKNVADGLFVPDRLYAEVLIDALADITGISESYKSRVPEPFTFYPEGTRSMDLGDATVTSSALELFGRVSRDISLESQRSNKLTTRQLLYLTNSVELEERIRKSERLNQLSNANSTVDDLTNALFLMILSRYPTNEEKKIFTTYANTNSITHRNLCTEIVWTLINSTEFLYNH